MTSYNPFKMWGSYVGALMGLSILVMMDWGVHVFEFSVKVFYLAINNEPKGALFMVIAGFLIGWGIHSLFRKFL